MVGYLGALRLAGDPRRRERRRTKGAPRLGARPHLHFSCVSVSTELADSFSTDSYETSD